MPRSGTPRSFGIAGVMVMICSGQAAASPRLGSAASFAVLGGSAVTNSGTTRIVGNVGVSPGSAVGLHSSDVSVGEIYRNDTLARQAQRDVAAASDELSRGVCTGLPVLSGTLAPGIYCIAQDAPPMTGVLTLDAGGNVDAVWIFRAATLVTAADSSVVMEGGGQDRKVFWQIGGAATIRAHTSFIGNVLASAITLHDGATLSGRLLARTGAVVLHGNTISACCEPIFVVMTNLPNAPLGVPYRHVLEASGGTGNYTFTSIDGALPPGLTLSANGMVSGTAVASGHFALTVRATDTHGCSGARRYTIVVPATAAAAVDTLSEGAMAMFCLIIAFIGYWAVRKSSW